MLPLAAAAAAAAPLCSTAAVAAAAAAACHRRRLSGGGGGDGGGGPAEQDVRAAYAHCAQMVKQHDPDNFVWVVQLPRALRLRVLALRAFSLEALLVGEQIKSREPLVMQIRFQWWRDALTALSDRTPPQQHPVLTALWDAQLGGGSGGGGGGSAGGGGGSAGGGGLRAARYQLGRILDAREQDALNHQAPLTLAELEGFAESTASQLMYLQLATAGVSSRDADHAASHAGKAVGLSLLLRGAAFQASRRRSYLPLDLCARHGVSQEDVYRGRTTDGLRDVALEVASAAVGHLREARRLAAGLPPAAPRVMQQGVLAGAYLSALERAGFDLFDPALAASGGLSPLRRVLTLKWHSMRGAL